MFLKTIITAIVVLHISLKICGQITFTDEIRIPCTEIKYQGWTGTCWCFSTTSLVESELLRMGKGEIDLSEMYTVRQTYFYKAQNYILRHGECMFGQGALAEDVFKSIELNGLVPEEIYHGIRTEADSLDHSEFFNGMKGFLDAVIDTGYPSNYWMGALNGIIDAYMGNVPESFTFNNKNYTPRSFADELDIKIDNYINITSFNHHLFNDYFILEIPDNISNIKSFNVKLNNLIETIDYSLDKGYSLVWNGEMSDPEFVQANGWDIPIGSGWDGILTELIDVNFVTQENRQTDFMSYQTNDDHVMHLIGRAKDENGNIYYIFKDSYFGQKGPYNGFIYMSKAYLKMRTISITLNKSGLPNNISTQL